MITAVMVGYNKFQEFTLPAIRSIQEHDPEIRIICIDNGSEPKYPKVKGVTMIHAEKENSSYASGINRGLMFDSDWYLILNNDILFHRPVSPQIRALDPNYLYACEKRKACTVLPVGDRLISWAMVLSAQGLREIGYFDEHFIPMWYDDVDYSWRAMKAGYPLIEIDLGIEHLERPRRARDKQNIEKMNLNYEYLKGKYSF